MGVLGGVVVSYERGTPVRPAIKGVTRPGAGVDVQGRSLGQQATIRVLPTVRASSRAQQLLAAINCHRASVRIAFATLPLLAVSPVDKIRSAPPKPTQIADWTNSSGNHSELSYSTVQRTDGLKSTERQLNELHKKRPYQETRRFAGVDFLEFLQVAASVVAEFVRFEETNAVHTQITRF
jgi:hypothetical protein